MKDEALPLHNFWNYWRNKNFENVYSNVYLHETGTYVFEKLYIKDQVWITYLNMKKIQGNIGRVNMLKKYYTFLKLLLSSHPFSFLNDHWIPHCMNYLWYILTHDIEIPILLTRVSKISDIFAKKSTCPKEIFWMSCDWQSW